MKAQQALPQVQANLQDFPYLSRCGESEAKQWGKKGENRASIFYVGIVKQFLSLIIYNWTEDRVLQLGGPVELLETMKPHKL